MLLSSVAESMLWSGRYVERAQGLARAVHAVERVSLDLPGRNALGLRPLLSLVASAPRLTGPESDPAAQLHALVLNGDDASSVFGALSAARENLRQARVVVPPELWAALNDQYQRMKAATDQPLARVLDALAAVLQGGSRVEGEARTSMERDAAYCFFQLGIQIERADLQLRLLSVLLPALAPRGWERTFDDVRWAGLLEALGLLSMYRRRHHHNADLPLLLQFALSDMACPRSVVHCLRLVGEELGMLPRAGLARAALSVATNLAFGLSHAEPEAVAEHIDSTLAALAKLHAALQDSYFPESAPVECAPEPTAEDART